MAMLNNQRVTVILTAIFQFASSSFPEHLSNCHGRIAAQAEVPELEAGLGWRQGEFTMGKLM